MISENKRITPELLGYSSRVMILNQKNKHILEFFNPNDELKKVELSINLLKARLVIPKETQDAIKLIRHEK